MRKIIVLVFVVVLVWSAWAGTKARIVDQVGNQLTINKGSGDGVTVGMKGIVKTVGKDASGQTANVDLGVFEVKSIKEKSCEIYITQVYSGFKVEDARYVVFNNELTAGAATTAPAATAAPAASTTPDPAMAAEEKPIAEKSVEWYMAQGDKAFENGRYEQALKFYQRIIDWEPQIQIAKEKYSQAEGMIKNAERMKKFKDYLKNSDQNYRNGDLKYALLYLVDAYRIYPEGRAEVQKRLRVMNSEYPRELDNLMGEKSNELKDVQDDLEQMLSSQESEKTPPAVKETPPVASKDASGDKLLQKVKAKAEKMDQNESGYWQATLANNTEMIYIPEGEFTLGSPEDYGETDEYPSHKIFLDGFWIAKTEVSFSQFDQFCQETKREPPADEEWGRGDLPVINVSWDDAQAYCKWLSKKTGLLFRLPTEAEWEKAAHDLYPWGSSNPEEELANYGGMVGRTTPVGYYPKGSSIFGVVDLAGNVWEWVQDWYDAAYYQNSPAQNPKGPDKGVERVVRGGGWSSGENQVRSANRSSELPASRLNLIGFRVVLSEK